MPQNEINSFVEALLAQGVINESKFEENVFFSLVMFLRKACRMGRDSIRKVVDFCLLNAYSHTWRTQFPGTLFTMREIPSNSKVFFVLYVS